MKSSLVLWVLFVAGLSACDAVSVRRAPADDQPGDQVEACPPLTYAENPTEAVSALPVRIDTFMIPPGSYLPLVDDSVDIANENIDGLRFSPVFGCFGENNYACVQRATSYRQMSFERDGLRYTFQTFYRFRVLHDKNTQPIVTTADNRSWTYFSLTLAPKSPPRRPWFLLVADPSCESRALQAAEGGMTNFIYSPDYEFPPYVTNPVTSQVLIEWEISNAPLDQWLYLGFATEAEELTMESGKDSQGEYLSMEKHKYSNGTTVVEQCGRVYNPALADIVSFHQEITDANSPLSQDWRKWRADFLERNNNPLQPQQFAYLTYWWNQQQGGLAVDFHRLLIPESLYRPLSPWYVATVHIGGCSRQFLYYVPECDASSHFRPAYVDGDPCMFQRTRFYLSGMPGYRLMAYGKKNGPPNLWSSIMAQ